MCSYCGCEAEPAISGLMRDHAAIAALGVSIAAALEQNQLGVAQQRSVELAELFEEHSRLEEAGLFAELRRAGEAIEELDLLVADHRRLVAGLTRGDVIEQPDTLRALLGELARHAETEDSDLFPFAVQVLPNESWKAVEEA